METLHMCETVDKKPELTLETRDSRGYVPKGGEPLIGTKWEHTGNHHVYTIVRFAYNGEDDTWMIVHTREGSSFEYLRTPINFFGYRSNGEPRYRRVL